MPSTYIKSNLNSQVTLTREFKFKIRLIYYNNQKLILEKL